jgi:hypothetical protein
VILKRAAESSLYQGLQQVTMTVLSCPTRSLKVRLVARQKQCVDIANKTSVDSKESITVIAIGGMMG